MLALLGRDQDIINAGGNKVSARLIEDALLALPQVTDAAAFGVPDRSGVERIWAAIVTSAPADMAQLQTLCARKLGSNAPNFLIQLPDLPRNANGKVVKAELVAFATSRQP